MSRITQRPAVGGLSPWAAPFPYTSAYTGTATPTVSNQAYGASPANAAQPSTGTGFFDPGFATMIGQKFDTSDGRVLTLVANGGTALVAGKLVQGPAQITTALGLAMTVPTAYPATAGSFQILVTNGSTVLSANQFQGGYLITQTNTGVGQTLKIASHQQAANAATFVVTLEDAIQTTLDATTTVSLVYNPYGGISASAAGAVSSGVIVSPSTISGLPIGVALYPIAASTAPTFNSTTGLQTANGTIQYGLIVTNGPVACLIATTTQVGNLLGPSQATAGALTAATLTTAPSVAISMTTQVDAKYGMVYMTLG